MQTERAAHPEWPSLKTSASMIDKFKRNFLKDETEFLESMNSNLARENDVLDLTPQKVVLSPSDNQNEP